MKELIGCFEVWLAANPGESVAYRLLVALADQTGRTADRRDPALRRFDLQELFEAAGDSESDYERAKRRFNSAEV